ncbi:alanyl-tRNA editing protein [Allohahella marinimesophila]|uniref:Alanine--tRNA ligase n=1 Tax=Allohahella marinimesophila TaxID=1054972 RepID=A0ABP7NH45_9GAMM
MPESAIQTRDLFNENPYQHLFNAHVLAFSERGVALDETFFYPTGGGQPGDCGQLLLSDSSTVKVVSTERDPLLRTVIWHQLEGGAEVRVGMKVQGCLDWERRYQHMRMHTCLHLLSAIVNAPVTGCSISVDKGRLDFDLPDSSLDKQQITSQLNELISAALEVRTHEFSIDDYSDIVKITRTQAVALPATEGMVRVVDIQGIDIQPCGGTHVLNTSEIGVVFCEKIEKKSRHNRRVILRFA